MTIGLKTPSSDYIELIVAFPPRPIACGISRSHLIGFPLAIDSLKKWY